MLGNHHTAILMSINVDKRLRSKKLKEVIFNASNKVDRQ